MKIGYARVSTDDQKLDLQLDALQKAGCEKIFEDKESGAKAERPGLQKVLEHAREGDTVVIWRLDRLGRSLKNLIELVTELEERGIGLHSLTESIDTTTSGGKLIFHVFGALAEFERNIIRERTRAGLEVARARGKIGGRPKSLSKEQHKRLRKMYFDNTDLSIKELCEIFRISRPTLYRYVETDPDKEGSPNERPQQKK